MKVSIKHRLEYAFFRMMMLGLGYLPESLAYGGASALGQVYFLCSKRRQQYALKFLRQAYPDRPEKELMVVGRRSTGNFLKTGIDMMRVHRVLGEGRLSQHVDAAATAQLPEGPILTVTGHLGGWEVGAIAFAASRGESHVIARAFKNPLLQRFIANSRRSAGLHLHSRRGGIRGLARALKHGAVGMQVVDQNQRLRGVYVRFFGKIASTERAAATLAVREGYPVALMFCPRIGSGFNFKIEVIKVIQPDVPADKSDVPAAVKRLVQEINTGLEDGILRYPEQYLWIHDRYRTQPSNQDETLEAGLDALPADPETV